MNATTIHQRPTFPAVVAYLVALFIILHLPTPLTQDLWAVTQASWSLLVGLMNAALAVTQHVLFSPFGF